MEDINPTTVFRSSVDALIQPDTRLADTSVSIRRDWDDDSETRLTAYAIIVRVGDTVTITLHADGTYTLDAIDCCPSDRCECAPREKGTKTDA